MTVSILSPKDDLMLDGEYDPHVAEENDARYRLECDSCGMTGIGTDWDLQEAGWSWTMRIDTELVVVTESEATCPKCNEEQEEKKEEKEPYEKALEDENQSNITEVVQ